MARGSKRSFDGPMRMLGPGTIKRFKRSPRLAPRLNLAMVRKAIGRVAEAKENLDDFNTTFNAAQTAVVLLNGVAEGTDYNQRIGRSMTHKYVEVSIGMHSIGATTNTAYPGDYGFWAIVLDRQPNGALAVFGDIFDGANGLAHRVTSKNQDRFLIIAREEWAVGGNFTPVAATIGASGAVPYHMRRFVDLSKLKNKDRSTKFQNTSNGIADIDEGALLFVAASTLSTAASNVLLNCNTKYRFTDV